jgi:hypothetical protein
MFLLFAGITVLSIGIGGLVYDETSLIRKLAGGSLYFNGFTCMFLTLLVGV